MITTRNSDFQLAIKIFTFESDNQYVIHANSTLDAEVINEWSLRGRGALFSHGGGGGRVVIVQHTPRKKSVSASFSRVKLRQESSGVGPETCVRIVGVPG